MSLSKDIKDAEQSEPEEVRGGSDDVDDRPDRDVNDELRDEYDSLLVIPSLSIAP